MSKQNVMLVISTLGGAGAELVVASLCQKIDRDRFNVSVCHLKERGERGEALLAEGYDIIGIERSGQKKTDYTAAFKLKRLIREREVTVLHSHNIEPLFECALCKLITPGVKLIHTYHFGNYPHLPFRYLLLEFLFSRVANKLVAVGDRQREQIMATYRLKSRSITTVYNGIEIKPASPGNGRHDGQRPDSVIIGSICTLIHQKGLDYLLEIARRLRNNRYNAVFWIVGEGPLRQQLEEKVREMNLGDMVTFFGWVPNAAQTILPKIDIFLQTSRWEAMSMVILEAMAAGKPVVATDVGENRRILTDAQAGFVVAPGDVTATVAHLESLLERPDKRLSVGRNGERAVRRSYSVEVMVAAYEALYGELVNANGLERPVVNS